MPSQVSSVAEDSAVSSFGLVSSAFLFQEGIWVPPEDLSDRQLDFYNTSRINSFIKLRLHGQTWEGFTLSQNHG